MTDQTTAPAGVVSSTELGSPTDRAAFDRWYDSAEEWWSVRDDALYAAWCAGARRTAWVLATREEIDELRSQVDALQKQCNTMLHQVLCCGVAASHPDATLTMRGAYAGKWNSPQAEAVRKLRLERDELLASSPNTEAMRHAAKDER